MRACHCANPPIDSKTIDCCEATKSSVFRQIVLVILSSTSSTLFACSPKIPPPLGARFRTPKLTPNQRHCDFLCCPGLFFIMITYMHVSRKYICQRSLISLGVFLHQGSCLGFNGVCVRRLPLAIHVNLQLGSSWPLMPQPEKLGPGFRT
jgi:hypothetical protein